MTFDSYQEPLAETSLGTYFRERLTDHARRLRPPPHDDTCWYLGSLLERFSRAEQFPGWQDGQGSMRPLALIYGDALQARSQQERCRILQHLGDMALFLGALFPQNHARRGILRDYFIGMGGAAYDYLAGHARHNRHIFAELAHTFAAMMALVGAACSRELPVSNEDVLALYQRWLDSGDALAGRQLQALGLVLAGSDSTH